MRLLGSSRLCAAKQNYHPMTASVSGAFSVSHLGSSILFGRPLFLRRFSKPLVAIAFVSSVSVSGCAATKVATKAVTLPAKAVVTGGKMAGKGVYYAGKGAYHTGKGVYYVGTVPVRFTNAALDTSAKFLEVTILAVDLTGKVITVSKMVASEAVEAELKALDTALKGMKTVKKITSVTVDVAEDVNILRGRETLKMTER